MKIIFARVQVSCMHTEVDVKKRLVEEAVVIDEVVVKVIVGDEKMRRLLARRGNS